MPVILWAISSRRGMVQGMEEQYGSQIIRADVPLAEMFGYATTLRSMSQGRATYTMEFHHFAEAPRNVADEIIARRAKYVHPLPDGEGLSIQRLHHFPTRHKRPGSQMVQGIQLIPVKQPASGDKRALIGGG